MMKRLVFKLMDMWAFDRKLSKLHSTIYDVYQLDTNRDKFLRLALLHTILACEHETRGEKQQATDATIVSDMFFTKFLKCLRTGL